MRDVIKRVLGWGLAGSRPIAPRNWPPRQWSLRHEYGIDQDELAMLLGISRDKVRGIENDCNRPIGVGFAVAWITLYGSRLPIQHHYYRSRE